MANYILTLEIASNHRLFNSGKPLPSSTQFSFSNAMHAVEITYLVLYLMMSGACKLQPGRSPCTSIM